MTRRLALLLALIAAPACAQVRTSQLPNATSLGLSDRLVITQGTGVSPRTVNGTLQQVIDSVKASLGALATQSSVLTSQLPAFTGGDVTSTGATGKLSLPAINSSPGNYADAGHVMGGYVDATGRMVNTLAVAITPTAIGAATPASVSSAIASTSINGTALSPGGNITVAGGGGGLSALTGDVSASGAGSQPATIQPGSVTAAKMAAGAVVGQLGYTPPNGAPPVPGFPSATRNANILLGGMFVTPEEFGAKGDNTTNDTVAIQNAINFASTNGLALACPIRNYKAAGLTITTHLRAIYCKGADFDGGGISTGAGIILLNTYDGGNYSATSYEMPSVTDQAGAGIKLNGASFTNITVETLQNNSVGYLILCDDTHLGGIDNTLHFSVIAGNTLAGLEFSLQGTAAGRNEQGISVYGNFMDGNQNAILFASNNTADGYLFNDSEFHITAIDGACGSASADCPAPNNTDFGIKTQNPIFGPMLFDIPGYFGQFGSGATSIAFGSAGLTFQLGMADMKSYAYFSNDGPGMRMTDLNRSENTQAGPVPIATAPNQRATYNQGFPWITNRQWVSIPASVLTQFGAGATFYLYCYSPYTTGYEVPRVLPTFSADIGVLSVQDASEVAAVDGSKANNLIVIKFRANSSLASVTQAQLFQLVVGE